MTAAISTRACPADQSAPLAPRSSLADTALSYGIDVSDVKAYLAARAAHLAAPHKFIATVVELAQVQP